MGLKLHNIFYSRKNAFFNFIRLVEIFEVKILYKNK
jgi:hypothetical protein